MSDEEERCQLCQEQNWHLLDVLSDAGKWNKAGKELQREPWLFPIGLCQTCHHVQITLKYTKELFSFLYFSDNEPPRMWGDLPSGTKNPYDEMLEFFEDKIQYGATITDFGCGEGIVLKKIAQRYAHQNLSLTGIDFNAIEVHQEINFISMDLNHYSRFRAQISPDSLDIAMSSHVLEHVVDPIEYLKSIRELIHDEGYIFIEVPDCEFSHKNIAASNLIIGQHIHYYTLNSLELIAQRAGLSILKSRHVQTNNISKLQLLMTRSKEQDKKEACVINKSAKDAILLYFSQYREYMKQLAEQVTMALSEQEQVGLWGIGGDLYQLIRLYPDIAQSITQNKLVMFDRDLAGYSLFGQDIRSSEQLPDLNYPVFIVPIKDLTRTSMLRASQQWKTKVCQ